MSRIHKAFASAWKVDKSLSLVDWCETALTISPRQPSPFHGQYSTSLTPWVRGILSALDAPADECHMVVVRKGTQSAGTTTGFVWLAHNIARDPGPMLVVFPTEDDAKSASETRFMPLIEDSPELASCLTAKRDDFKKLEYKFKRCVVRWIGANSASKLGSRPIRFLHITEIDKFKTKLGKEGSVADLAIQRTKRFWNKKIYIESSPTTQDGYVTRYFLKGDQRKYFVPCLKCGTMQFLGWRSHVKFDAKLPPQEAGASAYFQCESCGNKFGDIEKKIMVERGQWRPTVTAKERGIVSFDLGGLIPTMPGSELAGMVSKFLSVKDSPTELQSFVNSDLGETWEEQPKAEVDRGAIWQIRDMHKYRAGTIPFSGWCSLWLNVDVQEYFVPFDIWAHGVQDMALVQHGKVTTIADLAELIDAQWNREDGASLMLDGVIIDTGFKTEQVYDFVRRVMQHGLTCFPVKGDTGMLTSSVELIKVNELQSAPGIQLIHLHPSRWHDMAGDALKRLEAPEGGTIIDAWNARRFRLHFHDEIDREYVDELTAEVLMEDEPDKFGIRKRYWKRIRKANHHFDTFRYALVTRHILAERIAEQKELLEKGNQPGKEEPAAIVQSVGQWKIIDRRTR